MLLTAQSLSDLPQIAADILSFAPEQRIFLLNGDMGAGKTTLIKAFCQCLGTDDNVTSPTFAIVNEYVAPKGNIYHFDFYRLKNQTEALDIGVEEYFYSGKYCFIEWPEKIPALLPERYITINVTAADNNTRQITID